MGIGASIFLLAVGAILAFAVNFNLWALNIHVIGWILMAAGLVGLIMTLLVWGPRNRRATTGGVVEERVYDDRPAAY